MYVDLRIFGKALYISLFRRRFSVRRWAVVFFFCLLFWSVWCFVAVGRLLDHVLFPGFRKQAVRGPTFIIAPPRSGTTLLQNLMCLDEHRFACVKLYESIFPTVTWLRLIDVIAAADRRCGGPLARLLRWSEPWFFGGWDDMHKMRLTAPEEDECYFVYTMVAESVLMLFPYPRDLWIATRADLMPERARRRLMRHYESCLKRYLYARGREKTLLAKNPGSAGRVRSILEAFPDARIISIIRHPYESLPSHVSLFYKVWQVHSPEIPKVSDETEAYAEVAVDWYRNMFENRGRLDARQYVSVRYEDLVHDPRGTMQRIYGHFGWDLTADTRSRLEAFCSRSRAYRSVHQYSLEEYGLSRQWVQERLGDLLDEYSLAR